VTFYENVEVGPPTKSNRGALMKLLRHCDAILPLAVIDNADLYREIGQ